MRMSEVRTPTHREILSGFNTVSRSNPREDAQIIAQNNACQTLSTINFFGHDRFNPNLFIIPSNNKKRAFVVQEAHEKIKSSYYKPKKSLKSLNFHDTSNRQVRSERRECSIALLQYFNYAQDDKTGRIGYQWGNAAFRDIDVKTIAQKLSMCVTRVKRGIKDLVKAGYLKVTRQFKRDENGEIYALPSMKYLLPKFYTDLDIKGSIWTKIFSQREWARKRDEKKAQKTNQKKQRAMMGLIKEQMSNTAEKIIRKLPRFVSDDEAAQSQAYQQMLCTKALDLHKIDPSKSVSEYYAALRDKYPPK